MLHVQVAMSALGGVIVLAMFVVIFIVAMTYATSIADSYLRLAFTSISAILDASSSCAHDARLQGYLISGSSFIFNVTLTSCEVRVKDFRYVDVIIVYVDALGASRVEWLRYSTTGGSGTWTVVRVYYDVVNPINVSSETGVWDSGEMLTVNATTRSSISRVVKARMVFPSGKYVDLVP